MQLSLDGLQCCVMAPVSASNHTIDMAFEADELSLLLIYTMEALTEQEVCPGVSAQVKTSYAALEGPVKGHLQLLCLFLLLALAAGLHQLLAGEFEVEDLIEQLIIPERHVY